MSLSLNPNFPPLSLSALSLSETSSLTPVSQRIDRTVRETSLSGSLSSDSPKPRNFSCISNACAESQMSSPVIHRAPRLGLNQQPKSPQKVLLPPSVVSQDPVVIHVGKNYRSLFANDELPGSNKRRCIMDSLKKTD